MIWVDGEFKDTISVMDKGLLYGDGVFDTFRIFNGRGFRMNEHIDRLFESAFSMELMIIRSRTQIKDIVEKMYKKMGKKNVFVRIIVTRGTGELGINPRKTKPSLIIMMHERPEDEPKPIDLFVSDVQRSIRMLNPKIKSLNYGPNILAKIQAIKEDCQDAIMCDDQGRIAEATTTNIFFIKDGDIYTPSSLCPILNGITRQAIIENFKVNETEIQKNYVYQFDEVFLAGTANGITPVRSIDGFDVANYKNRPVTKKVIEWYQKAKLEGDKI